MARKAVDEAMIQVKFHSNYPSLSIMKKIERERDDVATGMYIR